MTNYVSNMFIGVAILGIAVACVFGMFSIMNTDKSIVEVVGVGGAKIIGDKIYTLNHTANRLDQLNSDMQSVNLVPGESQDISQQTSFIDRMWEGAWKIIGSVKDYASFTFGIFATLWGIFGFIGLIPDMPPVVVTGLGVIVLIIVIFGVLRYIGKIDL